MKLRDLIQRLEELEADLLAGLGDDVDAEVVAAYQPSYPLTGRIDGACVLHDDDAQFLHEGRPEGRPIVWLAIGSHPEGLSPYAPRAVFAEAE